MPQGVLGRGPRNLTPQNSKHAAGVSVRATFQQAQDNRRAYPRVGDYIAGLELPPGELLTFERSFSAEGHHTLWGNPADMLACVVGVVPV